MEDHNHLPTLHDKELTPQQMEYDNSEYSTSSNLSYDNKLNSVSLSDKQEEDANSSTHDVFMDADLNISNHDDEPTSNHPACQFRADKKWVDRQFHNLEHNTIKKPNEIENEMEDPPIDYNDNILDRVQGSMIGMALGDALGAHVEFRPQTYLRDNPVKDLQGGGTWGLSIGQFTDDTSMALCLANSLVARRDFIPYDQLVRYRWWYRNGYMSSTGECFDIGAATRNSICEFERRQKEFSNKNNIPLDQLDSLADLELLKNFDVFCSEDDVAGNGALMRLAPVPLFFYKYPKEAVEFSGISGQITHGDQKAYDACRYYGALIVAALNGETKEQLLDEDFYLNHQNWFTGKTLHPDVMKIAQGSYQKNGGYDDGIRGKGYIVSALEAALWAFWSDGNSFKTGALAAVNLGDDTDTTAAIYGQLAGAYYGYKNLPSEWIKEVYAKKFLETLSKWVVYEGQRWQPKELLYPPPTPILASDPVDDPIAITPIPEEPILSLKQTGAGDKTPNSPLTPELRSDQLPREEPSHEIKPKNESKTFGTSSTNEQPAATWNPIQLEDTNIAPTRESSTIVNQASLRELSSNGSSTPKRKISQCD